MPLYEYKCDDYGKRFEELVSPGASAECPGCGSGKLDKLMSGFAVGSQGGSTPELPPACGGCPNPTVCGRY